MKVVYAINLYEELEYDLGFDLGVNQITMRNVWNDSSYYHKSRNVSLASGLNRNDLKEHLYHEIGHSLFRLNRQRNSLFNIFSSGAVIGYSKKEALEMEDNEEPGPQGFISCYAMMNREEDWCETFSAFICNGMKTSGKVSYSNYSVSLEDDPLLKRKFHTVKSILKKFKKPESK